MHACLSRSRRDSPQTVGQCLRPAHRHQFGFYGAANDKYVPAIARQETAEQLAARWTREFQEGIDGTGIRPGIIKIGVDPGPLSEIDAKLVRAAAKTHLQTGLTIASHTGNGVAALEELEILKQEGVHPGTFIWVHAQIEGDGQFHLKAAQQGAWVEFDGISESSIDKHLQLVKGMIEQGFLWSSAHLSRRRLVPRRRAQGRNLSPLYSYLCEVHPVAAWGRHHSGTSTVASHRQSQEGSHSANSEAQQDLVMNAPLRPPKFYNDSTS